MITTSPILLSDKKTLNKFLADAEKQLAYSVRHYYSGNGYVEIVVHWRHQESNKPQAPHIIGADYAKSQDTTAVLCARCRVVLDSKDIEAHVCASNKDKQE